MKTYHNLKVLAFIIFLIVSFGAFSQSTAQTKTEQQKSKLEVKKDSNQVLNKSTNKESNLEPGCRQGKGKGCCRMKDRFIDKDNDGINDNRCNGIGFGKQHKKGKCKNRGCK